MAAFDINSEDYYNALFPEVKLLYRLNLLYKRLKKFLSDWTGINVNNILSPRHRAYVRGILSGLTNKELSPLLHFKNQGNLRKIICEKLGFFIKQFFKLEEIEWQKFGLLLQERGYKRLPSEIELEQLSKSIAIDASEIINQIEGDKVAQNLQSSPAKTPEQREELEKLGADCWQKGNFPEAINNYVDAIDGNVQDQFGSNLLITIILELHELEAYAHCQRLINYALPRISDRYDRSDLYLCRASYLEELSLKYCCNEYWRKAQNEYANALSANPANIFASWSMVKSSVEFSCNCQIDPQDNNDYLAIAHDDFKHHCQDSLQRIKRLPSAIAESIEQTLPLIQDPAFKADIINALEKFNQK